jgi:hypothetical protein
MEHTMNTRSRILAGVVAAAATSALAVSVAFASSSPASSGQSGQDDATARPTAHVEATNATDPLVPRSEPTHSESTHSEAAPTGSGSWSDDSRYDSDGSGYGDDRYEYGSGYGDDRYEYGSGYGDDRYEYGSGHHDEHDH